MKRKRFTWNHWFSLICLLFVPALSLRAGPKTEPSRAEFVLGTVCAVTLYDQGKAKIYQDVFGQLREIDNRMSINLADSDVSKINAAAGMMPVKVHDTVFEVIERAIFFAELSDGAFDPTIGPLVSLWGIGGDTPHLPSQGEIDAILPLVNWRDIEIDKNTATVFLKRPGMALDLGGVAKGYAADKAEEIVKKARLRRALIDLGGNIVVYGEKPDGSPWRVGLQNPLDSRGEIIGTLQVREGSVVTSGVYERNFEAQGITYHHIFSPTDGYPARNGLLSVTVIAKSSMDADALSTALFVLGYEKGKALIDSLQGIEAVFVFYDMGVRKTGGAEFSLTNGDFRLLSDQ